MFATETCKLLRCFWTMIDDRWFSSVQDESDMYAPMKYNRNRCFCYLHEHFQQIQMASNNQWIKYKIYSLRAYYKTNSCSMFVFNHCVKLGTAHFPWRSKDRGDSGDTCAWPCLENWQWLCRTSQELEQRIPTYK